jgi:hypothetical protein
MTQLPPLKENISIAEVEPTVARQARFQVCARRVPSPPLRKDGGTSSPLRHGRVSLGCHRSSTGRKRG